MDPATLSAQTEPQTPDDTPTLKALLKRYPERGRDVLAGFAATIEKHELEQNEPVAWIVTKDGRLLVFKRPGQEDWEDVTERLRKGERIAVVNRQLAMQSVLTPKSDELSAVFSRWPGIHARIGDALTVLVGADEELIVKKD